MVDDNNVATGKTAPRWVVDLIEYDPNTARHDGGHLLLDAAPMYAEGTSVRTRNIPGDCQHDFVLKQEQSVYPGPGDKANLKTKWHVSSICGRCCYHFDVVADYSTVPDRRTPCRLEVEDNMMHHLIPHSSKRRRPAPDAKSDRWVEHNVFECSSQKCPLKLDLKITPPRIDRAQLDTLMDVGKLEERHTALVEKDPDRYVGVGQVSPVEVLSYLRTYLLDALETSADAAPRVIQANNKKFQLAFGEQSHKILEYLGFQPISGYELATVSTFCLYMLYLPIFAFVALFCVS